MAERNERHFLEFYTPARQRLAAARRHTNTERKQTPYSDNKENPTSDEFGAIPATIAGEKAVGIRRQRRRLFTRSASKKRHDNGSNDDGLGRRKGNDVIPMTQRTEFSSPPLSGSSLSRALFSTDRNTTPKTEASPTFYSPPGSSKLLREYRSKESLLTSSKTRTSSFSPPIGGGLRLRPSALWKKGKTQELKTDPNDNPLVAAIERSQKQNLATQLTDGKTETTTLICESESNEVNKNIEGTTPTSSKLPPTTPKTTPKRVVFWSPPGTSKLLRKYRQRTQQLDQDPSTFKSPSNVDIVSQDVFDRSQPITRGGQKSLRLLDSGAKRCPNNRLSSRPRPAVAHEVTTPANSKARGEINTGEEAKGFATMSASTVNRSLLSPSTVQRLDKDINSYRQAHGQAKLPNLSKFVGEDSVSIEKTEVVADAEDYSDDSNRDINETNEEKNVLSGPETSPCTQFLPALLALDTPKRNTEGNNTNDNDIDIDALPFDEHGVENLYIKNDTNQSIPEPETSEDRLLKITESQEVDVTSNPSDEESGVFRSTRSAARARRQSMSTTKNSDNISDATDIDKIIGNEKECGVFRCTRSATRARQESIAIDSLDASSKNSQDDKDEISGVFRGTRSATKARRTDLQHSVEVPVAPSSISKDEEDDEDNGVFRSTRSSTRRKSLVDAEKAKSTGKAVENSLTIDALSSCDAESDLSSPMPPQDGSDTPSSKGSLRSIWDALHCVGGDNSIDSASASSVHANIVSRVGDCVNPMAATLMKMWREEEKAAVEKSKEFEGLQEGKEIGATALSNTSDQVDILPLCGLKTPPPKSFSTDLNLVYGLERVQNLTLARPKALQATRSMTGESSSSTSLQEIKIPPLDPCFQ